MNGELSHRQRYGFVTRGDHWVENLKIRIKYALMKANGVMYPDVYCIPLWLRGRCCYLRNGDRVDPDKYDLMFSELNGSDAQLECLLHIAKVFRERTVVLPGPPEIFIAYASKAGWRIAGEILRNSGHVWAFSKDVASFANHLAEANVARVIPWPFNYTSTVRIARNTGPVFTDINHVLIGCPMRFTGIAENSPHFLERCIRDVISEMPQYERRRFRFHGFVYTDEDKHAWRERQFGSEIGAVLEHRKSFTKFLKFMGKFAAVIHLSRFGILGRITFIAAALGKPGIFTKNVELNQCLYPRSLVQDPTDPQLGKFVRSLLFGLLGYESLDLFMPNTTAAKEVGNFAGNAAKVRAYLNVNP
jgi:hypothetical protein